MFRKSIVAAVCLSFVSALPVLLAEDEKPDATGRVTVKVVLDGKPVGDGRIFFYGETSEFIGTRLSEEGVGTIKRVFVGSYVVTFEGTGIPLKYTRPETSGLRVRVNSEANQFDFEIESN